MGIIMLTSKDAFPSETETWLVYWSVLWWWYIYIFLNQLWSPVLILSLFVRSMSKILVSPSMWKLTSRSATCGRLSSRGETTWRRSWLRSALHRAQIPVNLNVPRSQLSVQSFTLPNPKLYTLYPQVRDKLNLKVNSISAPEKSCSNDQPSLRIESLRWEKNN